MIFKNRNRFLETLSVRTQMYSSFCQVVLQLWLKKLPELKSAFQLLNVNLSLRVQTFKPS